MEKLLTYLHRLCKLSGLRKLELLVFKLKSKKAEFVVLSGN